jgi:hypothetical protein
MLERDLAFREAEKIHHSLKGENLRLQAIIDNHSRNTAEQVSCCYNHYENFTNIHFLTN